MPFSRAVNAAQLNGLANFALIGFDSPELSLPAAEKITLPALSASSNEEIRRESLLLDE